MKQETAGWTNEMFTAETLGKNAVYFHPVQVQNDYKSAEAGRPIFQEQIFIKKLIPGDSTLIIDRKMRLADEDDYPKEWAMYKNKRQNIMPGTPIDAWHILSDTQKAEFKALNIFTIDQFAQLPDIAGLKIMGFNELRTKAQTFISASKDSEVFAAMKDDMDAKLELKSKEINELRKMIESFKEKPKKLGRPKKVKHELHAAATG
jgi:hypothetical protein